MTAPEPTLLSSPLTSSERELAAIWAELLGAAPTGTEQDFFAAGGDSIQAAALVARACSRFGVELGLGGFVERPTIAALAGLLDAAEAEGTVPTSLPASQDGIPARCSYAQERFWFIDQASGSNVVSNVSWALRLDGPLDVPVLERALTELAFRHETLRTRFELRDGAPVQLVSPESELALEVIEATDEEHATALAAAAAQVPFDLSRGPLLRAQLMALGPDAHVLQLTAHHIVCDDWSKGVIQSDLAALYTALHTGEEPALAPPVQYPDFSRWQRERLSEEVLSDELAHWSARMANAPAVELPVDRTRPPAPSMRGARLRATVPPETEAALRALGREAGATFFMTMLAALQVLLHRYTRQEDLVVGTAIDNRGRVELEDAVGLFTNVLALRTDLSGRPTFRELVSRARASTLDAVAHQELPFDRLAAAATERDASRHPIFQVFYEFIVPAPLELALPNVRSEPFEVPKRTSEFDLGLYLDEQRGGLDAVWEYSSDLFEPGTIERMAGHFVRLLEAIVADPDRPIDELPLLDEAQRRQALLEGEARNATLPRASVQELFEAHSRQTPDAPAVIVGAEQLSYGELNRRANSIAHLLSERGVEPGDAVGVCLERSTDLIAAMLAILKAGAAYVPLHPDHPPARLLAQLDTAGARVLIAQSPLERFAGAQLSLEREGESLAALPDTDPGLTVGPDSTAYVLYTSGSTGVPKGVAVTHRNLANYTAHMIEALGEDGATSGLRFGSVSAVSTDLGNTAIFPALAGGGCLHLIATDVTTDGAAFAAYTAERPLDVLKITPSHLSSLLDAAADEPILPSRWLILGGEALSWELAQRVRTPDGPRVINHYGPTEATIGCCTYELDLEQPRPPAATVPIGRPISNATTYVLDALMEPVPVGVAGELYIGGSGIARGYVNQPEQTAAVFVADPFSDDPEARLYRTGDLARRLPDASLEFLGRADQQVKIRGYRVEPAEVQAVLMREPGVRQAAVLALGEADGRRLVAYVVADEGEVSPGSLQEALAQTLPAYMVPSQIALLDTLPLMPNGKLDRAALPSVEAPVVTTRAEPLSELEAQLSSVWAELLECEVGPEENFFEVGGHSLLAIRLIARMRTDLGVKLTLKALIEAPTIGQFAAKIESIRGAATPAGDAPAAPASSSPPKPAPTVPRAPREGPLRCSFAQEQFWLVDQLTPGTSAYNFSWPMRLEGRLDSDALGRAVAELVRRHEALRTRFTATDGQPMQIVEKTGTAVLELVDLTEEPDPLTAAERLIDEQTATPFDLARGPLLRVVLMRLGEQDHVLLIVVHHIVFDGVSKVVLYRELGECYEAFSAGREPLLEELSIQYADYAEWQRSQLDSERLESELGHWQSRLEGAPTALELPTDRPRPAVSSLQGARHRQPLSTDLRQAVDALARAEGATFFMAVLAAFEVLLYRYSGQEDLLVGTPVDTRTARELAPVIGPFINTVVVRGELSGSPSFRALLQRVQQRTVEALEHQELPFERLVATLAPERDLSRHPLFQALLALNPAETGLRLAGVNVSDLDPAWSGARVDLFLILDDLPQGLEAIWEYSSDLFEPGTIERMAGHFVGLLEAIVADPDRPIDDLALLGEQERALLLEEWNRTEAEIPPRRLEQIVAEHARARPDRVAVRFEERELSYGELDVRANRLANRLQALGAGPGELVGVCLNRSEELLVALLATMKAGAAYVPIDPGFPPARQEFMLADAHVRVLVTEEALLASLPASDAAVLCVDRDAGEVAVESTDAPVHDADADDLAYVIYTSGSTGKPKGVEIPHRALVNFLCSMRACPGLAAEDVLVAVTTLSFDIAGLELYLPLITGATIALASAQTAADPRELARLLESSGATVMQATPTTWRMLIDSGWTGRADLKALCGGEALPPTLADELVGRVSELWNMYGPTETTIWSTCARVRGPGEQPTIGRPIANTTLYVFDRRGRPAPIGVPGELLIGGAGLARGYRNRPELTAERFVTDELGERLYRTGDLARYRPDGTVQFLGRLDHQVKLRGFRIELGEIEATLGGHPAVAAAAATVHDSPQGEPSLIAYVVPDGEPTEPEELRLFLGRSLPAYMVPAKIVTLERLPLTPNGKIDRKALPAPELPSSPDDRYLEPRNATEAAVAAVFCEVLGVERAGAHDDFFGLGGQSLLAARLVSRLDARFEIELPLRALFEAPTVAGLASRVEALARTASEATREPAPEQPLVALNADAEPAPLLPAAGVRPASFAQERFWFIDQIGAGAAYNISWPLRVRGTLDVVALERALNEIVRRHEILRSRFAVEDGRPVQVIEPARSLTLEFIDLSEATEREAEAQRLVDERTQAAFDLAQGPLIRASLLRLQPAEHILQVVVHHAAADGGSKVVFFTELGALYGAYRDNRPAALPEPPIQYADFAQWQRSALQGERLERELTHWSSELDGIPAGLELPADHPRSEVATLRGGWLRTKLADDTLEGLGGLARGEGATLFMVMLAAFEVLLHRYSGQEDVVVGTPVDTRGRPELEQLIGPFVNTLVLRGDLSGVPSFRELLDRVKRSTLDAIEHQELPFERLVEALAPERELGRHPLFQALIALNPPEPAIELHGLEVEELDTEKTASRVDLTLLLQQREQGLDLIWEYSSDLFEPDTVQQMADHFLSLLDSILAHPELPIDELSLLREGEGEPVRLGEGERTFPVFCLHERFEEQARQTPDAIAVRHEDESLSYRELNERANRLAHRLRAQGVVPDALVALCLERSLELVVAVLAVLKAGGAYVPLDPEYPAERLAFVLGDCGAAVLVTQEGMLGKLAEHLPAAVVCVDRDRPVLERESVENPPAAARPENLAYVIYTSGSTGQPKGVLVEHRNVARLFTATDDWFAPGPGDTWTLLHSYAFDFSVWELWGALLHGGTLVVVPAWTARSPDALAQLLVSERATVLNVTPSLFTAAMDELLAVGEELCLRLVIFGGEALHTRLLAPWFERMPEQRPQLVNMYGITETTVHVTYRPLTAADAERDGSPIGRPIRDLELYVLDAKLKPVPRGVAGELFVGGAGVARGYLGRPELNEQRFIASPFGPGRLYRTGDRARTSARGELLFEGRLDDQVKIRGFRIELGEVQAALAADAAVAECAVIADSEVSGDTRLAAYVVPVDGDAAPVSLRVALREGLKGRLPEYMIPSSFTLLEALPLTTNGKLDRRALPAPVEDRVAHEPTPPRTELERELAEVWQQLLGVEPIGVEDDFFELGGHSLLAAQLAARVRARLGAGFSVRDVFEEPTIAGQARHLEQPSDPSSGSREVAPAPAVTARRAGEAWPLSYSQQQLWLLDQWDPGAPTYNVALPFRVRGALGLDALRSAVAGVLARHEALRTVVDVQEDQPVPVLLESLRLELESLDMSGRSQDEVLETVSSLARRPFDLARDPLLRCSVIRIGEEDHVVLIETHHIAFDGLSERILLDELAALYRGEALSEPPLQFGDFALWEHNWLGLEVFERELGWWRGHLAGARTSIELPVDRLRPEGRRFTGASHDLALGGDLAEAARRLCREESATPYMLVLATLATLLYRITGQDDVLVGSPVANRLSPELETLIGFFSNTLVFRVRMGGNPTFRELLRRVREMALDVYAHQGVPLEKIVEAVGPEREPGVNPLFQVNLRVSTAGRPGLELGDLEITPLKVDSGLARFDLALDVDVLEAGISGYFRYNRDIFEPATIARLSGEFEAFLSEALAEPDRPLLSFDLQGEWSEQRPAAGGLRGFRARGRGDGGAA